MGAENERSQTFVDWVLTLLEERFPWLGSGRDEPVGGADTVDELADMYKSLIEQRDKVRREDNDPRA
jgi:cytochrome P450